MGAGRATHYCPLYLQPKPATGLRLLAAEFASHHTRSNHSSVCTPSCLPLCFLSAVEAARQAPSSHAIGQRPPWSNPRAVPCAASRLCCPLPPCVQSTAPKCGTQPYHQECVTQHLLACIPEMNKCKTAHEKYRVRHRQGGRASGRRSSVREGGRVRAAAAGTRTLPPRVATPAALPFLNRAAPASGPCCAWRCRRSPKP